MICMQVVFIQHGQSGGGLLCCCKKPVVIPEEDRVELAFRRIDLNNDGFITWDEFVQVIICQLLKKVFQFSLLRMLETLSQLRQSEFSRPVMT